MSKVLYVKLNKAGVSELLKSPEMLALVEERAAAAVAKLGDGYEVTSQTGKSRVNASIEAVSRAARAENMANNSILKSLEGL